MWCGGVHDIIVGESKDVSLLFFLFSFSFSFGSVWEGESSTQDLLGLSYASRFLLGLVMMMLVPRFLYNTG